MWSPVQILQKTPRWYFLHMQCKEFYFLNPRSHTPFIISGVQGCKGKTFLILTEDYPYIEEINDIENTVDFLIYHESLKDKINFHSFPAAFSFSHPTEALLRVRDFKQISANSHNPLVPLYCKENNLINQEQILETKIDILVQTNSKNYIESTQNYMSDFSHVLDSICSECEGIWIKSSDNALFANYLNRHGWEATFKMLIRSGRRIKFV